MFEADPDELSTSVSLRLIEQLAEFPNPPMLVLTGGDPLCRTDIFQLIEHAVQCGLETSITPSATLHVTREAVRRLRFSGIQRMAISIDGADAKTHDGIRRVDGSFERSLEILRDAQQVGLPTQVNTTLTPGNVNQIEALAELLANFDIVLWSVFFLVPIGRAAFSGRLSPSECESAFERLWTQAHRQAYQIKTTEAPHYRRFTMQQERLSGANREVQKPFCATGINDGKGVLFVGHTGQIYPSGFMPISCGEFPHDHVVQVYQDSPLFKDLRNPNRLEGKCRQCEFRTICGGSRARAYAVSGNPFAEEPDCAYIPPSYIYQQ